MAKKNEKTNDLLITAIQVFGHDHQIEKAIEECAELTNALIKYRHRRVAEYDVQEEIADVIIMMLQLKMMFGSNDIDTIIAKKLERLETYLSGEN